MKEIDEFLKSENLQSSVITERRAIGVKMIVKYSYIGKEIYETFPILINCCSFVRAGMRIGSARLVRVNAE